MKDVKTLKGSDKDQDSRKNQTQRSSRNSKPRNDKKPQTNGSNPKTALAVQRLKDVTALNFDTPISQFPIECDTVNSAAAAIDYNINVVRFVPTLGSTEAANLAAQKWFGELRKVLNVPSTYEAGDLFMYIMAVEQLDLAVEFVKRIIRIANTYNKLNIHLPRDILKSMLFDIDEVVNNLPAYREAVNKTISAMRYLTIPYLTQSHALRMNMLHYIYRDSDDEKAQNILFVPEGLWKWDVASGSSTTPSDLVFTSLVGSGSGGLFNLNDVQVLLSSLLSSLLYDSDGQRIHGDILKVWGDKYLLGGDPIKEDEVQEFKFDPYILYMLHNATIHKQMGATVPTISWNIPAGSTSPVIVQNVQVDTFGIGSQRHVIDAWPGVTPDDIMNLCRWKSIVQGDFTTSSVVADTPISTGYSMPMEVLTEMDLVYSNPSNPSNIQYVQWPTTIIANAAGLSNFVKAGTLALAPIVYGRTSVGTNEYRVTELLGDRSYFTTVNNYYLHQLNLVATELNYDL